MTLRFVSGKAVAADFVEKDSSLNAMQPGAFCEHAIYDNAICDF